MDYAKMHNTLTTALGMLHRAVGPEAEMLVMLVKTDTGIAVISSDAQPEEPKTYQSAMPGKVPQLLVDALAKISRRDPAFSYQASMNPQTGEVREIKKP